MYKYCFVTAKLHVYLFGNLNFFLMFAKKLVKLHVNLSNNTGYTCSRDYQTKISWSI